MGRSAAMPQYATVSSPPRRTSTKRTALVVLLLCASIFTGCHPAKVYYFHETGDVR